MKTLLALAAAACLAASPALAQDKERKPVAKSSKDEKKAKAGESSKAKKNMMDLKKNKGA